LVLVGVPQSGHRLQVKVVFVLGDADNTGQGVSE
jgi:hypothetical protein